DGNSQTVLGGQRSRIRLMKTLQRALVRRRFAPSQPSFVCERKKIWCLYGIPSRRLSYSKTVTPSEEPRQAAAKRRGLCGFQPTAGRGASGHPAAIRPQSPLSSGESRLVVMVVVVVAVLLLTLLCNLLVRDSCRMSWKVARVAWQFA